MADIDKETMAENLMWAVKNEDMDKVKELVSKDKSVVKRPLLKGRELMCVAADFGHVEILQFLVENGADINVEDGFGMTPLLCAIYEDHKKCVKYLLSAGAKKTAPAGKSLTEFASDTVKELLK